MKNVFLYPLAINAIKYIFIGFLLVGILQIIGIKVQIRKPTFFILIILLPATIILMEEIASLIVNGNYPDHAVHRSKFFRFVVQHKMNTTIVFNIMPLLAGGLVWSVIKKGEKK